MVSGLAAQNPTLRIKAFQRYFISGVAPSTILEMGGKETSTASGKQEPEYFIYLIAYKIRDLSIGSLWINHHPYEAVIRNISCKPVIIPNSIGNDTLLPYTDEAIWQVSITGRGKEGVKTTKALKALMANQQLVLKLVDKQGRNYTRTVKKITQIESERGQ